MNIRASTAEKMSSAREFSLAELIANPLLHCGIILGIIFAIFFYTLELMRQVAGTLMFAMDDAWIHLSIAKNFVEGSGWGLVPGKFLSLSTSPTWTLLVGLAYLIYPDPVRSTLLFSLGCFCATAILIYFLAAKFTGRRWLGVLAAFIFIFDPVSLWGLCSGMELPLSVLGLVALLYVYYSYEPSSRARRIAVPIILGLAAITRPEIFVLIPLLLIDTWIRLYRGTPVERALANKTLAFQAGLTLITLLPYFALNLASHGLIFPTTYYAKTRVRGVGLSSALASGSLTRLESSLIDDGRAQIFKTAQAVFAYNPLVLLLLLPGLLSFSKTFRSHLAARGALLPLAIFVLPYAMGVSSPASTLSNHANRYFAVFAPLAALLSVIGLNFFMHQARMRAVSWLFILGILLAPTRTTYPTLHHVAVDSDSTQRLYVDSAKWINENMPKEAVFAVNDIGTLAFFTGRDMIDVMGLATTDIWPALQRAEAGPTDPAKLREYLREKKVEYLMLSPRYYPEMTKDAKTFEPIMKWSERHEHGRTISPQVMYRVHW